MRILVVNAGSSSLKLSVIGDGDETLASQELTAPAGQIDPHALRNAVDGGFPPPDAVGHRIVHGGARFRTATIIDAEVERELRDLTALAPLHQPKSLGALDAVSALLPGLPAVACFDTAFHATLPAAASTYALPRQWSGQLGIRRYGFHGLSHSYAARRTAEILRRPEVQIRIVTCHLGAGASLAAVDRGRSVETTMGFTPLEGLVMATRSGSVDPGLLLWLLERGDAQARELGETLEHRSGLLGLAGTADMREILARQDADAALAIDVYDHRLKAGIAAMASAMNGVDAVTFTGGIGQNSPQVRARAIRGLDFLGLALDEAANESPSGDCDLSAGNARARTVVVTAREDLEIARQVREVLTGPSRAETGAADSL